MKAQHPPQSSMEQKTHCPKAAIKTKTDLVYSSSLGNVE